MAFPMLAQTLYFVAHQIPLFLLVFGLMYLVFGYVIGQDRLALPVAGLSIASALAWFYITGTTWSGLVVMPADVMQIIGVSLVAIVLGKVFSA